MNDPRQDDFREALRMILLGAAKVQEPGGFLITSDKVGVRLTDRLMSVAAEFAKQVERKERENSFALESMELLKRFFDRFNDIVHSRTEGDDRGAYEQSMKLEGLDKTLLRPLSEIDDLGKSFEDLVDIVKEHATRAMLLRYRGPRGLAAVVLQRFGFPGETHMRKVQAVRDDMVKESPPLKMAYFFLCDVIGFPEERVAAAIDVLGQSEVEARFNILRQQTLRRFDSDGGH